LICMKLRKGNTLLKRNGHAVPRDMWPEVTVREDDLIEMLILSSGG
jgi:sulfur carrier protein ThiS